MSNGIEMMMKTMLGVDPADIRAQLQGFIDNVNRTVIEINQRQERVEAALARIEAKMDTTCMIVPMLTSEYDEPVNVPISEHEHV